MSSNETVVPKFSELGLSEPVLRAVNDAGYEQPSPIQAATIPHVMSGVDLVGQAQTGTGKTAAFALPILSNIDTKATTPQVLVLAPTRELAIQVAEAFQGYAHHMKGLHVLPIYGGQDYGIQLRKLRRGVQVVVGTPGRVMDHIRKGTLKLGNLKTLILDEADEMLRMGFIDDVEWILEQIPTERQILLFSATMPMQIRRISRKYLSNPKEITIKTKEATATTIRQRMWMVSGGHKLDVLTRILEVEEFDGMIIFARTKAATVDLAERLQARGFAALALNGDIQQNQRERIVGRLKSGSLDILVATDVAARGLDVERVSHVINYDIPQDTESYVHRIGRTGRAGRKGDAILFVAPRERHLLRNIERATKSKIEVMKLPSIDDVNNQRFVKFKEKITNARDQDKDTAIFQKLLEEYESEHNVPMVEIASALAALVQGADSIIAKELPKGGAAGGRGRGNVLEKGKQRFRIEVGHNHRVNPGKIVGVIANEAGIRGSDIGQIRIAKDFTVLDLPEGMPSSVFETLSRVQISGKNLNISEFKGDVSEIGPQRNSGGRGGRGGGRSRGFSGGGRGGRNRSGFRGGRGGGRSNGNSSGGRKR